MRKDAPRTALAPSSTARRCSREASISFLWNSYGKTRRRAPSPSSWGCHLVLSSPPALGLRCLTSARKARRSASRRCGGVASAGRGGGGANGGGGRGRLPRSCCWSPCLAGGGGRLRRRLLISHERLDQGQLKG